MRSFFILALLAISACTPKEIDPMAGLLDRPPTRPRTYNDATPLDPNDMNEIFDANIALRDELEINIPAAAFAPVTGAVGDFDGERWNGPASSFGVHGLTLPVGAMITHVEFHYRRGTDGNLSGHFERMAVLGATGTSAILHTFNDAAVDGALHTHDLDTADHEIATGFFYWLRYTGHADAWANGAEFIGATVYYYPR